MKQPLALRLADALETTDANISLMDDALWVKISPSTIDEAATELRRLHEVNQNQNEWLYKLKEERDQLRSLREELINVIEDILSFVENDWSVPPECIDKIHKVYYKATGEQA